MVISRASPRNSVGTAVSGGGVVGGGVVGGGAVVGVTVHVRKKKKHAVTNIYIIPNHYRVYRTPHFTISFSSISFKVLFIALLLLQ